MQRKERLFKHLSRYVIYFLERFTCLGLFYTPLPSFRAHPSLFVSLMAFSSLPTIALSPYQSICAYAQYNLLTNCITSCHLFVHRHLITGDSRLLIHPRVSFQNGSLSFDGGEKYTLWKSEKKKKGKCKYDRVVSYGFNVWSRKSVRADKSAGLR